MFIRCVALALAVGVVACAGEAGDSSLIIRNESSYAITEIYLSPVSSGTWGPDLLGGDVLFPGEEFAISLIDCDDYDIRIVDEDGDECVIEGVELCFDDALWRITDTELAACVLFQSAADDDGAK